MADVDLNDVGDPVWEGLLRAVVSRVGPLTKTAADRRAQPEKPGHCVQVCTGGSKEVLELSVEIPTFNHELVGS